MALDVVRVTVMGGGKRKVATRDRRGAVTDRYDVRWRVQLRSGETRMFRQRFGRAVDADQFVSRLRAAGLSSSGWHLDDDGRPTDRASATGSPASLTVWDALLRYRSATWPGASANGRKTAAFTLRAVARVLKPNAPALPTRARAYLNLIAFRAADEPAEVSALAEKYEYEGELFGASDLITGREFIERWSLPIADLDRDRVRRLIAEMGAGRAAATEGRRWAQLRAVLRWWHDEGIVTADLTRGVQGPGRHRPRCARPSNRTRRDLTPRPERHHLPVSSPGWCSRVDSAAGRPNAQGVQAPSGVHRVTGRRRRPSATRRETDRGVSAYDSPAHRREVT